VSANLPNGWTATQLDEVAMWSSGGTPSRTNSSFYAGAIPWFKTGELGPRTLREAEEHISENAIRSSSAKIFPKGSVVLAMYGATIGKASILGVEAATNQACAAGIPDAVSSIFLYFFLLSQTQAFIDAGKGGAQPNISQGIVKGWPILLPPLDEQTRIVEKLEELLSDLDAGVAELKAAQAKLVRYRQSLLKAAVEGALTAEWRQHNTPEETGAQLLRRILSERRARWEAKQLAKFAEQGKAPPKDWQKKYPEPVQPDTADLPELPEGWVWASVDQCSKDESAITDGPFGSNLKSSHYQENGPRVIRLQNIGDGVFIDAKAHISPEHYEELTKHAVAEGDLVIAMLGETLPRACVVPEGVSPAIVKADCARVRLNTSLMPPHVLMSQLNSKPVRDIVLKFVKGIGRPRVNLGHIRAIPVAVCSMQEQLEIEKSLIDSQNSIDEQHKAIELSLKQSTAQRKNILRAAFSGQLVPQDPNDEPANALLARIRAQREADTGASASKRGRKAKGTA
jgi:type I restriction enzyme, S subunit